MTKLNDRIERRAARVRGMLAHAADGRTRLSVFRSSKHIYAQVIDDDRGVTLASASSLEKAMREGFKTGARRGRGQGRRQAASPSAPKRRASRTWCSIAAAISITAGSRRWPMPRARAG